MIRKRTYAAVLVAFVVLLAGCSSIPGLGGGGGGGGGAGSADWCQKGGSYSFANPQTGEQTSMNVQGIVSHNGRQTCKAVWETNSPDGQVAKMELFFTENSEYTHVIMYDGSGNKLYEVETTPTG